MIAQLRKRKGLNQTQLAELLGCSGQLVSKWEVGGGIPPAKKLYKLASVLDVPLAELMKAAADAIGKTAESGNAPAVSEPAVVYQPTNVRSVRPHSAEFFRDVPFLSAKAQAGPARLVLTDCTPYTGETHPVLAELVDVRYAHLVLEIEGHSMEPELRTGSRVLARLIKPNQHEYESGGIYAVLYADRLVIKRIRTNDLGGTGKLTLHSDNPQFGTITVAAPEIQCMWRILYTIYQPVK